MRRMTTAALAALASLALVAGCSNAGDGETSGGDGPAPTDETSGEQSGSHGGDQAETGSGAGGHDTFPVTVTHNNGETTIDAKPERIVVLDMAVLDTLDVLGAGERVVGTTAQTVPTWLKDADGIDYTTVTDLGTMQEPDMEAIARLNPDLVILGGRSSSHYAEFAAMFPTIDASVPWTGDTYSVTVPDNIKMIATAVGESAAGSAAADAIAAAIESAKDSAKDLGTAMVLMSNAGEVSMHGPRSRWAPIYDVFGFTPVVDDKADEGHRGEKISFETVKELNPDWIFVVDRDAAVGQVDAGVTARQVLDNELVNATTAAQKGHIVYLDSERWYIVMTGASNFLAELAEITEAVNSAK